MSLTQLGEVEAGIPLAVQELNNKMEKVAALLGDNSFRADMFNGYYLKRGTAVEVNWSKLMSMENLANLINWKRILKIIWKLKRRKKRLTERLMRVR